MVLERIEYPKIGSRRQFTQRKYLPDGISTTNTPGIPNIVPPRKIESPGYPLLNCIPCCNLDLSVYKREIEFVRQTSNIKNIYPRGQHKQQEDSPIIVSPRIKRISSTSRMIESHHLIRCQNPDLTVQIHAMQEERWLEDIEYKKVVQHQKDTPLIIVSPTI